jgi:hypothetical protein
MTYHRRQRLESFKRAMFAELLKDGSSGDEASGQTDTIKQDHEPWGLLPPQLSRIGTGQLLS